MKSTLLKKSIDFLKIALINVLIIIGLLTFIDPFFSTKQILPPDKRSVLLKEYPPNLDMFVSPNENEKFEISKSKNQKYRLRTNKQGFIIGSNQTKNNKKAIDLIFFGGSTTECLYVNEDLRFPYLVGELLENAKTKLTVNSLNSGKSGNNSLHSTLNLLGKGIELNPKIVLFMHNVNDLSLLTKTGSYYIAPKSRRIVQVEKTHIECVENNLASKIQLLFPNISQRIKQRILLANTSQKTSSPQDEWQGYRYTKKIHISYKEIEQKFEKSVKTFISVCKSHNIQVVLMTQFNRIANGDINLKMNGFKDNKNISIETYTNYYRGFNNKIREIARKEGILLVDLEKLVPSNSFFIYDAVHLKKEGSVLVAKIISKELAAKFPKYFNLK